MSTVATTARGGSRQSRGRARATLAAVVTFAAVTASCVALVALGDRHRIRADVTGTGVQTLSPRTTQILARLDGPYRVVVAADFRATDLRARQRAADVLDEMKRASPHLTSQFIDTSTGAGMTAYRGLVGELIDRDGQVISDQAAAVDLHAAGAASIAVYLSESLSPTLLSVKEALPPASDPARDPRKLLEQAAGGARLMARDLTDAAGRARDALKLKMGEKPLPRTDLAAKELVNAYAPVVNLLGALDKDLTKLVGSDQGPGADLARQAVPGIRERRDQAAVVLDSLKNLRKPDVFRVTDVLAQGSAVLIIGPAQKGLAAIDTESLLPPGTLLDSADASRADLQRRAEELLATSLGSLLVPHRPIVVLTHAENVSLLESTEALGSLTQRLRLRGVDFIEWSVLGGDQPPTLSMLDPGGERPVVYLTWPPDSAAPSDRGGLTGAQRAVRLAEAVARLVEDGKPVCLTVSQSLAPTIGDPDPFAGTLEHFGLAADSGRPLVREVASPRGRMVETECTALPVAGPHALSGALSGLPALVPWAVALYERPAPQHVRFATIPLLAVISGDDVWAETQWLRLWQTPRDQRPYIPDLPVFDSGRDGRWPEGRDTGKPQRWMVAAAVERSELRKPVRRFVAVGSNGWFIDPVTQQRTTGPDGRPVLRNPGNLELFDAAVSWLAGQDDLIAQSPTARAVSMVKDPGETPLVRLRLAMALGLPALVLLLGVLYKVIRR